MKIVEVKLYEFDELSDAAKQKARDWWRESERELYSLDASSLYEDFEKVAECLGITFRTHNVQSLVNGQTRQEPNIWWLLDSPGAGASFEGRYEYAKGSLKKLREYAPNDEALQRIAERLLALQKRHGYQIAAEVVNYYGGREVHKGAMGLDTLCFSGDSAKDDSAELLACMRDFADWMYKAIRDDYDYRMTDENVDDSIRANEYTFRENGQRSDG